MSDNTELYIVKKKIPGVKIGETLRLDESQTTFKMKGLVNDGGWLYVVPKWMIQHAIDEGFIEEKGK